MAGNEIKKAHIHEDLRVVEFKNLPSPRQVKSELPIGKNLETSVTSCREHIVKILRREEKRLLVIVGPCSIHDEEAALDYAARLNSLRVKYADKMEVLMRVYFEKPRTTIGWKGLINDPHLDGTDNIEEGITKARRILIRINGIGLPAATEGS